MYQKRSTRSLLNLVFLFTAALSSQYLQASQADDILKKAKQNLDSKGDQAHVELKIIEPGGDVKVRKMVLQILRTKDGFKSMIRMTAPPDVKDTAVLAEVEGGQDREWLYLPSTKQVRRIASSKKSTGILGSELSAEDLDPMALKGAEVKLLKSDSKTAEIAIVPKKGSSEYNKIVTTFNLPQTLPAKTEYYKAGKVVKTVEYQDYKQLSGIYRAQKIHIMNVQKKRGTDIEFSEMKVNPPLQAKDFTPDALKESW